MNQDAQPLERRFLAILEDVAQERGRLLPLIAL